MIPRRNFLASLLAIACAPLAAAPILCRVVPINKRGSCLLPHGMKVPGGLRVVEYTMCCETLQNCNVEWNFARVPL